MTTPERAALQELLDAISERDDTRMGRACSKASSILSAPAEPAQPVARRYRYHPKGYWHLAKEPALEIAADLAPAFEQQPLYTHPAASSPDAMAVLRAENEQLRVALRFYAGAMHYHVDAGEEFDTVSDEPQNWLCSGREDSETMIENGEIARLALLGKPLDWMDGDDDHTPQPIEGERALIAAYQAKQEPTA